MPSPLSERRSVTAPITGLSRLKTSGNWTKWLLRPDEKWRLARCSILTCLRIIITWIRIGYYRLKNSWRNRKRTKNRVAVACWAGSSDVPDRQTLASSRELAFANTTMRGETVMCDERRNHDVRCSQVY